MAFYTPFTVIPVDGGWAFSDGIGKRANSEVYTLALAAKSALKAFKIKAGY